MSHEEAVEIIKSAPNPVTFVIQSLLPWVKIFHFAVVVFHNTFWSLQADEDEKEERIISPQVDKVLVERQQNNEADKVRN